MKKRLPIILAAFLVLLLAAAFVGYVAYAKIFLPNVPDKLEQPYVLIPTNSTFEQVVDSLHDNGFLIDSVSFRLVAEQMQYKRPSMRSGRFEIQAAWSNQALIRHLRTGKQATVDLVLTNERLPENIAAKAARFLEQDSLDFVELFQDTSYLASLGYTSETLISLFIPNTYNCYWNTSPKAFLERMQKEHDNFWKQDKRKQKATTLERSEAEVYTVASIVERETLRNDEKKRMAGVYLNRLKRGMPLQADPTAVFARRDFGARRVTDYHTKFDSPYNTYMYAGLPPGPISMASISSIDGVLNAESHNYLYFCAKGDGSGYHNFARSLSQHNRNARIYRDNLRKRGLR